MNARVVATSVGLVLLAFGPALAAPAPPHVAPPQEVTLPAVLTIDEALHLFHARGLDLLLAEAAVAGAQADERTASEVTNPAINVSRGTTSGYNPSRCAGCSDVAWSLGLTDQGALADALTGKRRLRVETARRALAAARLERDDAERTVGLAVKQQYLAVALSSAALEFTRQGASSTAETAHLVDVRYRAGAVSEADTARAETAKLEADQTVAQAAQALRQAQVGLAFLLGVRKAVPDFRVGTEFFHATTPGRLAEATHDSLLQTALTRRPDLRAQQEQQERAKAALALAGRQRIPDVALSLQYSREGTGQNAIQPPTTSLGLGFEVPVFNLHQGEVARAEADAHVQSLQLEKVRSQVVSDVEGARASFTSARERAQRMESGLLERATRARDLVKIQYEKGAASLLELLDVERTLIAARVKYLQDLNDYWTAVFQLEAATGTELR